MCCALLLTFLFPTGEPPRRVVKMGDRVLERQERLAGAVIGAWCQLVPPLLEFVAVSPAGAHARCARSCGMPLPLPLYYHSDKVYHHRRATQ